MNDDDLPPTDDDAWGEYSTSGKVDHKEDEGAKKKDSPAEPSAAKSTPAKKSAPVEVKGELDSKPEPAKKPIEAPKTAAKAPQGKHKKVDQPKADKTKADKPKTDKPKSDRPKTDKPKTDKPKADRPKTDQPKADRPKTDHRKPITKEPKPKKAPSLPERAELGDTGSRAQVMKAVKEPKDSKAEPKVVVDDKDKDKDKPKKGKKKRGLLRRDKKPKETKKGAASGSKPPDKKEPRGGSPGGGWSRRRWVTTLVILVAVAGIGTLSYLNSQRYYFVCHSKKITAERGRLFPLGQTELDGDEWRAISIDPAFDCKDSEVGSEDALAEKFAQVLLERADDSLGQEDADVDEIDKQLSQALLLTRGGKSRRKRVERLRGDVAYRRALESVQEARASLETAAKTFDDAATKRPIHASDASGWSKFAAEIGKRLDRGPHDLCPDCAEAGLSVPPVAIPGPPDGPATPAQPGGQNPDAGVPASGPDAAPPSRGGVLL